MTTEPEARLAAPGDAADLYDELERRGVIAERTDPDAIRAAFAAGPVTFYVGFDPTGPSLHHGHLVQLITARRLQLAGHRPIALVGGSTGLVGDPNPDSERTLNDPEVVAAWVARIQQQIAPLLDFEGPAAATLANNLDWTAPLSAIEFLRDIGKHFRVNRMIAKEAVAARLSSDLGINYTEFSYQILQSLDFLELYRRYGCTMQTGGSDQWGNLTSGVELVRKAAGATVHAMATPLLTRSDGTKFGKTSGGGALWLDPEMTSPYAFHQYWLNATDADIGTYLAILSFRPLAELAELATATAERPYERAAQRALADELTTLVHGAAETAAANAAAQALFGRGELRDLPESTLRAAAAELPTATLPLGTDLAAAPPAVADLFADAGLSPSRSAARRTITEGGAYVNNARVTDVAATLQPDDLLHGHVAILRRGRRELGAVVRATPEPAAN